MKHTTPKQVWKISLALLLSLGILSACTAPAKTRGISDFDDFFDKYVALGLADALLGWDIETGGAPDGALDSRSRTIGIIEAELFTMAISDDMKAFHAAVEAAEKNGSVDDITQATYRLTKSDYDKQMSIPVEEFQAFSELTSVANAKWVEARAADDYSMFSPYLQGIMDYNRKVVDWRAEAGLVYDNPYDAMLDDYEPGLTVAVMDAFFDELRAEIVPLLDAIEASDKIIRTDFKERDVPVAVQKNVADFLMDTVGFDFEHGVRAEAASPFTMSLSRSDVRITARYDEAAFFSAFYAIIHESGHALYEQNTAPELEGTILGRGVSFGIHESQSRLLENMVGRNQAYLDAIYDEFQIVSEGYFADVSKQELYEAMNVVRPTMIRITSDELTYSLHILVRYEIEKLIMNDHSITADDLPAIWNEKMQEYLGITPQTYAEGILQDVHWSYGEFGYFPTYALGTAYAAQIWDAMGKDIDQEAALAALDLDSINNWLHDKVHKYGSLLTPTQVFENAVGASFDARYYIEYLEGKYRELYGLG